MKNRGKKIMRSFEFEILLCFTENHLMSSDKKECPSCAMEVHKDSKICPICSYEFPQRSSVYQWVAILLVIVFLLTMLL